MLKIIDKSKKFKHWLESKLGDPELIKEYYKEITSNTWVDKLPAKYIRWSLFTTSGVLLDLYATNGIGTAIGMGLGAADGFIFDRLIKGWKPNIFVEDVLAKYI